MPQEDQSEATLLERQGPFLGASCWHLPASLQNVFPVIYLVGKLEEAGEKALLGSVVRDSGKLGTLDNGAGRELQA